MPDAPIHRRPVEQRIAIFRDCFSGLAHVYGTYDPESGRVWPVKAPVTDRVLLDHLIGRQSYGVYLLSGDRTRAAAADFDEDDLGPPQQFVEKATELGLCAYIERSKRKGHHVWLFADAAGVSAEKIRRVIRGILSAIGQTRTEIFPKQDRLSGDTAYGNFINSPLFGRLVPQGRTVFLNPDDSLQPYADQWGLLENVTRLSEAELDQIHREHLANIEPGAVAAVAPHSSGNAVSFGLGLLPCARTMLAGVDGYQRVACFRLAIHLKRHGIPKDLAIAMLQAWAAKNRPADGRVITDSEVSDQTRAAFQRTYRGCGCEDPKIHRYCHPSCPLLNHRQPSAAPRTSAAPISNEENEDAHYKTM